MEDTDITELSGREGISDPLTDILRKGARQLIQSAVEGELATFLVQFAEDRTATGHAAIVRNGYHPERAIQTGIGPVTVKIPKVRSKTGHPVTFHSALWSSLASMPVEKSISWPLKTACVDQPGAGGRVSPGLKKRSLNAPELAIGDGAMGFWAALEEVFPTTRQQRCRVHKANNVVNYLPKLSQPKARKMLHDIWQAETHKDAVKAFDLFIETHEPKFPKAIECLLKDRDELLAFFDFPAQPLAVHPHQQSYREHLRYNRPPNQTNIRGASPETACCI